MVKMMINGEFGGHDGNSGRHGNGVVVKMLVEVMAEVEETNEIVVINNIK